MAGLHLSQVAKGDLPFALLSGIICQQNRLLLDVFFSVKTDIQIMQQAGSNRTKDIYLLWGNRLSGTFWQPLPLLDFYCFPNGFHTPTSSKVRSSQLAPGQLSARSPWQARNREVDIQVGLQMHTLILNLMISHVYKCIIVYIYNIYDVWFSSCCTGLELIFWSVDTLAAPFEALCGEFGLLLDLVWTSLDL